MRAEGERIAHFDEDAAGGNVARDTGQLSEQHGFHAHGEYLVETKVLALFGARGDVGRTKRELAHAHMVGHISK